MKTVYVLSVEVECKDDAVMALLLDVKNFVLHSTVGKDVKLCCYSAAAKEENND